MVEASPEVAPGIHEGDVIAGKYRIKKLLGSGGMGVVVAAQHMQLGEPVAIKFLRPEALLHTGIVARFAREAKAAVRIKSEHVARITDVGTLESGAPYIVMEYLQGGDLQSWVRHRGVLSVEQAVEFVLQACEAIAEAHTLGIIHRDLKPANLFCIRGADDLLSIKVLDFGISKMTDVADGEAEGGATTTSAILGSPHYMSPEQARSSRDVDARTDIWSLGVVLYELLTGALPFASESVPGVFVKIATEPPPPLRPRRPDLPGAFEQIVQKCLQKDRDLRYRNVAEFALALAPFAPKRSVASVERIERIARGPGKSRQALELASTAGTDPTVPATTASWGRTGASPTRKTLVPIGVAAAVIAMATVAGGVSLLRSGRLFSARAMTSAPLAEAAASLPPEAVRPTLDTATGAPPSPAPGPDASAPMAAASPQAPPTGGSPPLAHRQVLGPTPPSHPTAPAGSASVPVPSAAASPWGGRL
ncbi:MAG: protein kinase [Polyangiaceae bacterium]|jgi:serine/threonine-protein kinase